MNIEECIELKAKDIHKKVISWRRDIHQHPELGNLEFRTSRIVAEHLRALGFDEVQTDVAYTGVVGILKGNEEGPVVALRADMDALPVTEETGLPFASKVRGKWRGKEVGVMHAGGHDAHTAILMGVAEILSGMRDELQGVVKFIFQPCEEDPAIGDDGGAKLMIEEGVLENPAPSAIFGLHVFPGPAGAIGYCSAGAMASSHYMEIKIKGKQTHAGMPWQGVDSIVAAAQVVNNLQLIPSRMLNITRAPSLITVATIHSGTAFNVIPEEVVMTGTLRCFDEEEEKKLIEEINSMLDGIATTFHAEISLNLISGYPVVYNDPNLLKKMLPTLNKRSLATSVYEALPMMGAEDFSYYQQKIPGLFFFLGIDTDGKESFPNHSSKFTVNEDALISGVKTLANLAVDYLRTLKNKDR